MSEQLRVFVGGPIQHLLQSENSGSVICSHREIISALRDAGCTVLSAHEAEAYGELSPMFSPAEVTARDYAWAAACDVYVALLPTDERGVPYRTDGTHVEIGWATALGKRVILLLDETPNRPYGHLVLGLIANRHAIGVSMSAWRESLLPSVLEGILPAPPEQEAVKEPSTRQVLGGSSPPGDQHELTTPGPLPRRAPDGFLDRRR